MFGKRPYADITPLEWMEFLRGMEQQGILEQMSRVHSYCRDAYDLTGRPITRLKGCKNISSPARPRTTPTSHPMKFPA